MRKTLFILCLFIISGNLFSQNYHYDFNDRCQRAYEKIILLQMDSAQYLIRLEQKKNPSNLIPVLLVNYYDFIEIVIHENEALFEQKKEEKKTRLNLWKQGPKNSPWYLSGQAQIKLQWAFTRVLFDEYFTAATEINSAYHILEENKQLYPEFLADNMGIGILHAMIGVIPDQYQWALDMFGFYGSIELGVTEIKKQLEEQENDVFHAEALFYYSFVRMNLQTDAIRFSELLQYYETDLFKNGGQQSPLLSFSKAVILLKIDNDEAIHFLQNLKFNEEQAKFHYNTFLLGQALLYQLNPASTKYLEDYIKNYPGNNYKKTALQRQAWSQFIIGDTLAYQRLMKKVLLTGTELLDADKSAKKEALAVEEGYLPNVHLLKSRIQFDGHYYKGALMELNHMDLSQAQSADQLEYHYRKGRIYHEMHRYPKANKAYNVALNKGKDQNSYYAANASLKMGEIAEEEKNWTKAKQYYKTCLSLDFSEYRRGIRAKAKAGLQRVERMMD